MTNITLMELLDKNKAHLESLLYYVTTKLNTRALFYNNDTGTVFESSSNLSRTPSTPKEAISIVNTVKQSLCDYMNSLVTNLQKADDATKAIRIHVVVPLLGIDKEVSPTVAVKLREQFTKLANNVEFTPLPRNQVTASLTIFRGWVDVSPLSQGDYVTLKEELREAANSIQSQLNVRNVQTVVEM